MQFSLISIFTFKQSGASKFHVCSEEEHAENRSSQMKWTRCFTPNKASGLHYDTRDTSKPRVDKHLHVHLWNV